jgi:hypothetical protein
LNNIIEDQFFRIASLLLAIELNRVGGRVVGLDHVKRLPVVQLREQLLDVPREQEVAVDEHPPLLRGAQIGCKEAGERELRRGGQISWPGVKAEFTERRLAEWIDRDRNRP